jgi:molybdenum cofactor cytidylyltransferase
MVPAIVLAAGKSSRMGRSKAMLPLAGGDTFLSRIVRTLGAAGVQDVVVVVGHSADAIVEAFAKTNLTARFVDNPSYERGQLSSLLTGLSVVDRPGVIGALVALVDAPLFAEATVRAVIDRHRVTRAPVVRPVCGSRHGHPILIDRSLFDAVRAADAAAGVKPVVRANTSHAGDVEVDDEGAFVDVDTPEEYERVRGS